MLTNIQFLRFVAAMLVVMYHSSSHVRSTGMDQGVLFSLSEGIGFAGVDVFFVISGFIMAWTTRKTSGTSEAFSFFRRRLARIYSGYWPFFIIALLIFAWANPEYFERADLWKSAFLWPTNHLLLAVSWTLIFELFFYCCYTILVTFPLRSRHVTLLVLFVAVCVWSAYSHFVREAYAPGNLEYMSLAEYYMASPYLAEFLAGALLAIWLMKKPQGAGWSWLIGGSLLFISGAWWNQHFFDGHIEQGYWVFYRVLVFGIPSCMILLGLVRLEKREISAPVRFSLLAGGASYAIYLSHTLILTFTQKLGFNEWAGTLSQTGARLVFIILAGVILAYSIMHYRMVERPLHKFFQRLVGIRPKTARIKASES
ncbi:MAG TPA: acyltransferase [Xanthomonadales bacterium]|nr:acyltransferase [Xanthomonadales bacterium]